VKNLKKVFSTFSCRFNNLFNEDSEYLQEWKKTLKERINNKELIQNFNSTLSFLFNTKPLEKNIKIYLLLSSPSQCGGGANMDKKSITLEISRYPISKANQVVGIIWHELIHLYFEKSYYMPLLERKFDQETANLVKEATASFLLPNGILGKSFLNINKLSLNIKISTDYNKLLLDLTNEYVKSKRPFDEFYIENAASHLAELKGVLK